MWQKWNFIRNNDQTQSKQILFIDHYHATESKHFVAFFYRKMVWNYCNIPQEATSISSILMKRHIQHRINKRPKHSIEHSSFNISCFPFLFLQFAHCVLIFPFYCLLVKQCWLSVRKENKRYGFWMVHCMMICLNDTSLKIHWAKFCSREKKTPSFENGVQTLSTFRNVNRHHFLRDSVHFACVSFSG